MSSEFSFTLFKSIELFLQLYDFPFMFPYHSSENHHQLSNCRALTSNAIDLKSTSIVKRTDIKRNSFFLSLSLSLIVWVVPLFLIGPIKLPYFKYRKINWRVQLFHYCTQWNRSQVKKYHKLRERNVFSFFVLFGK